MELQHLKYTCCPACGERVRSVSQDSKHCNGDWFETMIFICGMRIDYVPNYKEERIVKQCPDDPDEILYMEKRTAAKKKLAKYINKLDVDDTFKDTLKRQINGGY